MKKNKGFTLVELIGIMVVLAIISLLIVPQIIKVIKDSKDNLYQEQVNLVLKAAKNYGIQHYDELDEVNITFLTIDRLISTGFIENDETIDPRDNSQMKGCVMVSYDFNSKKYNYEYLPDCDKNKFANKLTLTDNYSGDWQAEVQVTIETSYLGDEESTTYRYCVSSSRCTPNIGVDAARGTIDVETESETAYVCAMSVTSSGGESNIECAGPFKVDKTAPVLTIPGNENLDSLVETYDLNAGVSVVDNVTPKNQITLTRSGNISLGTLGTYTLTYTAKDKAGNVAIKKRTVKVVDVTKPNINLGVSGNPYNSYGWATNGVDIAISATDLGGSGVAGYYYCIQNNVNSCTPNQFVSGKSVDTLHVTTEGDALMVCVQAKDGSNNKSDVKCLPTNQKMKIDMTSPTCSLSEAGTTANGWYTTNATISFASKSSDVTAYGMGKDGETYNSSDSYTVNWDTDGVTVKGYVRDKAGRTGSCSKTVKRDTVSPSCSLKIDTPASQWSWRNQNTVVSFDSKSDDVTSYNVTTGGESYDGNTSTTISWNTNGGYVYGYVKDRANHTASCNTQVYVDMSTPNTPSASVSGKTVTANSAGTDGPSGICWYSLNDGAWQESNQWTSLGNGTYTVKTISCSGVVSAASGSVVVAPAVSHNSSARGCLWSNGSCSTGRGYSLTGVSSSANGSTVTVTFTLKLETGGSWMYNGGSNDWSVYACLSQNHNKNTSKSYCKSTAAQLRGTNATWNKNSTYNFTKTVTIENPSGCYDVEAYRNDGNNGHMSGNTINSVCFN